MPLLLSLLNPFVWREGRAAHKFNSFSLAEEASMVDMLEAANLTTSVERAALYIRHANDEARHAKMFFARSVELREAAGLPPLPQAQIDTEGLFARLGEKSFLAFVHLGEAVAIQQFHSYISFFRAKKQSANFELLLDVSSDEIHHERYTYKLLVELAGSELAAKHAVRQAKRWRAWRAWRRAGRSLTHSLHTILMYALYGVSVPFALLIRFFMPGGKGWRQLK